MKQILEVDVLGTTLLVIAEYAEAGEAQPIVIDQSEAQKIVEAWVTAAPGDESEGGPWLRASYYIPKSGFITALSGDGELTMSIWPPKTVSGPKELYSLHTGVPFVVEYKVLPRIIT